MMNESKTLHFIISFGFLKTMNEKSQKHLLVKNWIFYQACFFGVWYKAASFQFGFDTKQTFLGITGKKNEVSLESDFYCVDTSDWIRIGWWRTQDLPKFDEGRSAKHFWGVWEQQYRLRKSLQINMSFLNTMIS